MRRIYILSLCSFAALFALYNPLHQSHAFAASTSTVSSLPISTLSIYGAKVATSSNNTIVVTFALHNDTGAQPDIRYGVELLSTQKGQTNTVLDQYLSSETLSLAEKQTVGRTVSYAAPAYLPGGTYRILVIAQTDAGTPLGFAVAGKATFTQSKSEYVAVDPSGCFLTIGGSQITYIAKQRLVALLPTQSLRMTCTVQSHLHKSQSVSAVLETHTQSQFGVLISTSTATTSVVAPSDKKQFSFMVPISPNPQTYAVAMYVKDSSGTIISNTNFFRYIIEGDSATILNVLLDKDHYAVGDTAIATMFWTSSVSTSSQLSTELKLTDGVGSSCTKIVTQGIDSTGKATISLPITATCVDPVLSVSIKDPNGTILAQKTYAVNSPGLTVQQKLNSPALVWGALAAIIIVGAGSFIFYSRRRIKEI